MTERQARVRTLTLDELAELRDQIPEDVERGLILPVPAGFLPIDGTVGLPALAQRFEEREGLLVPARPATQPIDLVAVYLSAREDFGFQISMDEIDAALSNIPIQEALWILAQVCQRTDRSQEQADQVELARSLLPVPLIPAAVTALKAGGRVATSAQVALTLALHALIHCPADQNGSRPLELEQVVRMLGILLLGIADHSAESGSAQEELTLEFARNDLFFRLHGHLEWYVECYELLFKTLPELADHPDFFDIDASIQRAHGLTLGDFWALTALFGGVASMNPDRPTRFGQDWGEATIEREILENWLRVWSVPFEEARKTAAADLATESPWSFSTFRERPIVMFDENGYAVRSHYFTEKATPTGMFWAIRDVLPSSVPYNQWSGLFGAMVEHRIHSLLAEHVGDPTRLLTESWLRQEWGDGKTCDLIVDYPDAWVAFEYVFRNMSRPTQVSGDYGDLTRDLGFATVEKLKQIDETFARGLERIDRTPARLFAVVVIGSAFPSNPLVYGAMEHLLQEEGTEVLNVNAACRAPLVLDLFELRSLLEISRRDGILTPDLLDRWLMSGLAKAGFRNWIASPEGPAPSTWWQDKEWVERSLNRVLRGGDRF